MERGGTVLGAGRQPRHYTRYFGMRLLAKQTLPAVSKKLVIAIWRKQKPGRTARVLFFIGCYLQSIFILCQVKPRGFTGEILIFWDLYIILPKN